MSGTENKIQLVIEAYNKSKPVFAELDNALRGLGDKSTQAGQKHDSVFKKMKENWVALSVAAYEVAKGVKEAFDMIERGARAQQAEESFKAMASAANESADELLAAMMRASNGTVDNTDIMQKAVKGLSQGLSGDQMIRIMETARVTARAAGQDVTQAYEGITDAIANKMPRALLRYGLVTREQMRLLDAAIATGTADIDLYEIAMANGAVRVAQFGGAHEDAAEKIQKLKTAYHEFIEEIEKKLADLLISTKDLNDQLTSSLAKIGDSLLTMLEKTPLGKAMKEKGIIVDVAAPSVSTLPAHTVGKYGLSEEEKTANAELEKAKKHLKEIEDRLRAIIAMKQKETDLQLQMTDLDIKEKEESVTHSDAARERLRIVQELYKTQIENQTKINRTALGGEQNWEAYQKAIGETAKKLSEAGLALQDITGTAKQGSDLWIKQQQAANSYAAALVDVEEQERKISKTEAIQKRLALTQELIDLAEMEAGKVAKNSREWHVLQARIEQLRGIFVGLKQDLDAQSDDFTAGFKKGFADYLREAKTTFQDAVKLAQETAQAMERAFSDFFFDAMNGKLKHFSDYVQSFLQAVARSIANIMASDAAQGIAGYFKGLGNTGSSSSGGMTNSSTGSEGLQITAHSGGLIMHHGGYVPRFHVGGLSSDERPAILQSGEYVVSRKGVAALDRINQGQAGGGVKFVMNINNQTGNPIDSKNTGVQFDGEKYVVSVILNNIERGGSLRYAFQSLR